MSDQLIGGRDFETDFSFDAPEFNERYDDVIRFLHERCPVVHSKEGEGYWVVARHDDLHVCAQDWETFVNGQGVIPNRPDGLPPLVPEELDGSEHQQYRQVLNPYFTPGAVAKRKDAVRQIVDSLIDAVIDAGECDFALAIGKELPGLVFFQEFLGLGPEMLEGVRRGHFEFNNAATTEARAAGFAHVEQIVRQHLEERENAPDRGDLVDAILRLEVDGNPISRAEQTTTISVILSGGTETTSHVLVAAINYLASHPEDQQRLRDNPSIIPRAVEEFVRCFAPAISTGRTTTSDVVVGGQEIPAGQKVMLAYAAACRDPMVFEDPEQCLIDRPRNAHLGFGLGPHRCIGLHLARMQLAVALEQILQRMPDLRLAGKAVTSASWGTRAYSSLPITFGTS